MSSIDRWLLTALGACGWACGFALLGLTWFAGHRDFAQVGWIFAAFGAVAGAVLVQLRLALTVDDALPQSMTTRPKAARVDQANPWAKSQKAGAVGPRSGMVMASNRAPSSVQGRP